MLKKYDNKQSLTENREGGRLKLATPTIHYSLDLVPCDKTLKALDLIWPPFQDTTDLWLHHFSVLQKIQRLKLRISYRRE